MTSQSELEWNALVAWLESISPNCCSSIEVRDTSAGRGLFLTKSVPPATRLISIPSAALLHISSLAPHYPASFAEQLSATEWITLHLALQLERDRSSSSTRPIDHFQPFIASLPKSFPTVPLSWLVQSMSISELSETYKVEDPTVDQRKQRCSIRLLEMMSPSVRTRVDDVAKRFRDDWLHVQQFYKEVSLTASHGKLIFADFLLSWLNVNSRCVFFDLGLTSRDNLTLAPVIDMINHTSGRDTPPRIISDALTFSTPSRSSLDPVPAAKTELLFTYGPHDDPFLMAEYGFVVSSPASPPTSNPYNSIDISAQVESLFSCDDPIGKRKRELLEDNGYWGESTVQSTNAQASWRVLMQIGLHCLDLGEDEADLQKWMDVLMGEQDEISKEHDERVMETLKMICRSMKDELEDGLRRCSTAMEDDDLEMQQDEVVSLKMLELVWRSELDVVNRILAESSILPAIL